MNQKNLKKTNNYEFYISKSKDIFWTTDSVNKPTETFFNEIVNNATWVKSNHTPNWVDELTLTIVCDSPNYTIAKLINTQTNYIQYWLLSSINKVMGDAYELVFKLDVFSTYCYHFYNEYIPNNAITINRTSAFYAYLNNKSAQLSKDSLIGELPFLIKANSKTSIKTFTIDSKETGIDIYDKTIQYKPNSGNQLDENIIDAGSAYKIDFGIGTLAGASKYFNVYWDVFLHDNGELECFINTSMNGPRGTLNIDGETDSCGDNVEIIKHPALTTKYKGRYYIPHWYITMRIKEIRIYWLKITNGNYYKYVSFVMNFSNCNNTYLITDDDWRLKLLNPYEFESVSDVVYRNKKDIKEYNYYLVSKFHQLNALNSYFNICANIDLKADVITLKNEFYPFYFDVINQPDYLLPRMYYTFADIKGFTVYNCMSNTLPINIGIYGYETVSNTSSAYSAYISSTISQTNTNLAIAKQDMIKGNVVNGINAVIGGGLMFAGGFNLGTGAGMLGGAVDGFINTNLNYWNKQRQIQAQHADKLRSSTATTYTSSDERTNQFHAMNIFKTQERNFYSNFGALDNLTLCGINTHDASLLNAYNMLIWENGYEINENVKLSDFSDYYTLYDDNVNQFIYWDIEFNKDAISDYFIGLTDTLKLLLNDVLNQPVRFWKIKPNYDVPLIQQAKKIHP